MRIENLRRAIASFDKAEADFEGPKADSLIGAAEAYLGVVFPPDYREFLRRLGAGSYGAAEFYGLIGENFTESSVPDAVWLTNSERRFGLSDQYVLVGATGDGGWYAIDTEASDGAEGAAIVELDASGRLVQGVAKDFGEYFEDMIADENSELGLPLSE